MKKSGIVDVGAGNVNENGETVVALVVLAGLLCELAAGADGWRGVAGRGRRLAERTRHVGCFGRRRRPRRRPVFRPDCGRHFGFEPAGVWRGAGVTVTVTVGVVMVVVGVGFAPLFGAAASAGLATVVVGVSPATAPAPKTSVAHHANVDVQLSRRARAIAACLTGVADPCRACLSG